MSDYVLRFLKIYDVGSFPNLSMFEKRFEKFWKNPYPSISSDIRKLGPGHVRRSETLRSRLAAIDSLAKTNLEIQICDRLRTTIIYMCVYICVYIYVYNVYIYTYVHHWFWIWKSLGIAWGQPIFRYQAHTEMGLRTTNVDEEGQDLRNSGITNHAITTIYILYIYAFIDPNCIALHYIGHPSSIIYHQSSIIYHQHNNIINKQY